MIQRMMTPCAMLICGAFSTPVLAQSIPPIWQTWISGLPAQGYTITQGTAAVATSVSGGNASAHGDAAGSGTPSPYIYLEPYVPIGAEYVDPYYAAPLTVTTPGGVQANPYYRLSTSEAVITIVALPPLAAYFSFQTNMYTRLASLYPKVQLLSPDPSRAAIFGSTNGGINDVTIQRQSGFGFGQNAVAIITTPNYALATSLARSFAAAGGSASEIFADPVGSNIDQGLSSSSDDLVSVFRYSDAQDFSAASAWVGAVASNILVYRIEQPAGAMVKRYGAIPYADKLFNAGESSHAANVSELAGILQNWLTTQKGAPATVATTQANEKVDANGLPISGDVGGYCIQNGTNCGGDDQDTDAYKAANVGKLPAGSLFFVVGVDHTVTNNATFLALNIQGNTVAGYVASAQQVNAAAAGFASGTMTGSAAQVLQDLGLSGQASPQLMADLPNLFVQIFSRKCAQQQTYCTQPYTTILTPGALPYADTVKMSERAYVLPGQVNGANPTKLLNPKVVY